MKFIQKRYYIISNAKKKNSAKLRLHDTASGFYQNHFVIFATSKKKWTRIISNTILLYPILTKYLKYLVPKIFDVTFKPINTIKWLIFFSSCLNCPMMLYFPLHFIRRSKKPNISWGNWIINCFSVLACPNFKFI